MLELDLEGTWKPFTAQTPHLILVVKRDGESLELGYEPTNGAEAGKKRRIGRIAVSGDAMFFTSLDEINELRIEMRRQGESAHDWSVNVLSPKGPVAVGTASVDDSGRKWSARVAESDSKYAFQVDGWVSTDGEDGKLTIKVQRISENGSQDTPDELVFVRVKR
ncbi:hypothetical protein CJO94_00940 [Ralstonia solanacearum]|nr:hypothetical protein CJO94_00940 [Ralstonia solanacearum]